MPAEDGFVPTPDGVADYIVAQALVDHAKPGDRVLYPGCGTGQIAAAAHRRWSVRGSHVPEAVAVDTSAERLAAFEERFAGPPSVPEFPGRSRQFHTAHRSSSADAAVDQPIETHQADFLLDPPAGTFDFIVANPPYVRYSEIDADKRERYSDRFDTAAGQFDLYQPFVEQMVRKLAPDGTLAFLSPDNYLCDNGRAAFRQMLRAEMIHEPTLIPEAAFPKHTVRTMVTTIEADNTIGLDSHFTVWALGNWDLEAVLAGCDVPENDFETIKKSHRDRWLHVRRRLEASQRWQGFDGGYKPSALGKPDEERQSDLGRWA